MLHGIKTIIVKSSASFINLMVLAFCCQRRPSVSVPEKHYCMNVIALNYFVGISKVVGVLFGPTIV